MRPIPVEPGERVALDGLTPSAVEVPHALDRRFRTYAWRLDDGRRAFVYTSDVARLEPSLERFARGPATRDRQSMWQRQLFAHLTIDRELPGLCRWPVERILLTQIGRRVGMRASEVRAIEQRALAQLARVRELEAMSEPA